MEQVSARPHGEGGHDLGALLYVVEAAQVSARLDGGRVHKSDILLTQPGETEKAE